MPDWLGSLLIFFTVGTIVTLPILYAARIRSDIDPEAIRRAYTDDD